MMPEEFKIQIFKTKKQWESGLRYRLENLKEGGIGLCSMPSFEGLIPVNEIRNPAGLATDECRQLYIMDGETCRIYRYDPKAERLEKIPCIGGCGSDAGEFINPGRILVDKFSLWVLDTGNRRIQAFSRENYQIKYIIDDLEEPVDASLDEHGNLYVLDRESRRIFKYSNNGVFIKDFHELALEEPIGLAVGKAERFKIIEQDLGNLKSLGFPDDILKKLESIKNQVIVGKEKFLDTLKTLIGDEQAVEYKSIILGYTCKENIIYVIDRKCPRLFWFKGEDIDTGEIIDLKFIPTIITIDKQGNIFIVEDKTGKIYQFDLDGSYVGVIPISDFTGIKALAVDGRWNLYASSSKGIAFLSGHHKFTKEQGFYYSRTLDSGIPDCQWHRLALRADIPPKTVLDIYYYCSDVDLKRRVDECLSDNKKSAEEKRDCLEREIPWIGPEKNPKDMLFRKKTGRYLWLKLALSTFDEDVRPTVTQMKVCYPRTSYLRYLPATYQENEASREFLERFLSIFETIFYDLETDISRVFKYYDPSTTPRNFLSWLASWLNLALEEDWPEEKKREFIKHASFLYEHKGTPGGIKKFIEIYTGKVPIVLEHSRTGKPMILGKPFWLGINSLLVPTPVRGFRLGDDSIIGRVALRDKAQSLEDPFLALAHRFTVILDLSSEEFALNEKGLRRILDEEKPAHTMYSLHGVREMRVGLGTYIGINARVSDYRAMKLEIDSILGTALIAYDSGEKAGKVERHSKVEVDTLLI